MQVTVSKLFQKFIAKLSDAPDATLYVQKAQPAEADSKATWHTVLIHGRHDGTDQPLAMILMAVPSQAPTRQPSWSLWFDGPARSKRRTSSPGPFAMPFSGARPRPARRPRATRMEKLPRLPRPLRNRPGRPGAARRANATKSARPRRRSPAGPGATASRTRLLNWLRSMPPTLSTRLLEAVRNLLPIVTASLLDQAHKQHQRSRGEITGWAVEQEIALSPQNPAFAEYDRQADHLPTTGQDALLPEPASIYPQPTCQSKHFDEVWIPARFCPSCESLRGSS